MLVTDYANFVIGIIIYCVMLVYAKS